MGYRTEKPDGQITLVCDFCRASYCNLEGGELIEAEFSKHSDIVTSSRKDGWHGTRCGDGHIRQACESCAPEVKASTEF